MHIVANVDSNRSGNTNAFFPQTLKYTFRRDSDNNRAEWIGKQLINDKKTGKTSPALSQFIKHIADGDMYINLAGDRLIEEGDISKRVILYYNYTERLQNLLKNPNFGGPLFGKVNGSNYKDVADLLSESSDLHIHDKKENIDGMDCLVLEGTSKYGKVTAWISPEKGYNVIKWIYEKESYHLYDDAMISTKWPEVESGQRIFNLKEFHEIINENNTIFVPKLAYFTHTTKFHDGTKKVSKFEYRTSDIQLKPDFEALGAFKIDLPDGIRVLNKDFPSVKFIWEKGKPVRRR